MRVSSLFVLAGLALAGSVAAQQPDALSIVVLAGEDGVNIIQQKTAVQPVVEVRDRNKLPVAGVLVTFSIGGGSASFANGAAALSVTTNASGQAAITGLQPLQNGAVNIQVSATYQGQTVSTTITQTNFATAADAAQAGKVPGSQSSSGSTAGGAAAGAAAGAAVASGGAAGTAGAAAGGSGGGMSSAAVGGIVAGGVVGAIVIAKVAGGGSNNNNTTTPPNCTAQDAASQRAVTALVATVQACGAANCDAQFNTSYQQLLDALSAECTCLGNSGQQISASEKAGVQNALAAIRAAGFNTGNIPACFQ